MFGASKRASKPRETRLCAADDENRRLQRCRLQRMLEDDSGQGTTEYAILVGVIVVIAIVAIVAFRGRLQELWQAITDGINSL